MNNETSSAGGEVAVIGAGVSGRAAAALLIESGSQVCLYSQKRPEDAQDQDQDQEECLSLELGTSVVPLVVRADAAELAELIVSAKPKLVVVSPGIPEHSPLVKEPIQAGLRLVGEVQLAWDLMHNEIGGKAQAPWLCITGTNGKTTTVGMTGAILRAAGIDAMEVGNIGYPITAAMKESADVLVVELSSFQLATSPGLFPLSAICLNVDSDHLDWHGTREKYVAAKARVYDGASGTRFCFADQFETVGMAESSSRSESSRIVKLRFGVPSPGELGVVGSMIIDRAFQDDGSIAGETTTNLIDLAELPLLSGVDFEYSPNDPMVRDALAAVAMARSFGVPASAIRQGLEFFHPAGHRRARIKTSDGITWIDDSKATNVHAALAAANAVQKGTLLWIVGGDAKGQDLSPLLRLANQHAKALILVGADPAPLTESALGLAPDVPLIIAEPGLDGEASLRDAVRACAGIAVPGDTVLLAPGCASWDQFESYEKRGDVFERAVRELQVSRGD